MAKNKSVAEKVVHEQRMDARRAVLEELFNDMYDDRRSIYIMNFVRGIFFGLGSVIGATIVVGLLIWVMSFFVDFPGLIGDVANSTKDTLKRR